ncbi:MAG: UDP-N-acetylglucosamine 2-epimerase (non-hydrolyzing), partial [Gammaproteobacteria bacterium]
TAKMLSGIEQAILAEKPNAVIVYGDTNSTLAGALAAVKLHVPVCHVEAGLRSFNRKMPEEINRIMTDHASDLLFAPTERAVKQLTSEGVAAEKVILSGDVMYDAALYYGDRADLESRIIERLNVAPGGYILATIHRAENTDSPETLTRIIQELDLAASGRNVILPIHPRTRSRLNSLGIKVRNITLLEPVGYLDMIKLEKNATLIITDSGGVQKEAYFFGKACITLRAETEWVELVEAGVNRLVDMTIAQHPSINDLIKSDFNNLANNKTPSLYGTGNAAGKIVEQMSRLL